MSTEASNDVIPQSKCPSLVADGGIRASDPAATQLPC